MCYGMLPITKAVMLVVVSFFVLLGVTKADSKNLKKFGRLIACALWTIAVFMVLSSFCPSNMGGMGKRCPLDKFDRGQKMMKCW